MATIQKRKWKHGITYRAFVRIKGHKPISRTFDKYHEASTWAKEAEEAIRDGKDLNGGLPF